jgi:hypothetical protein
VADDVDITTQRAEAEAPYIIAKSRKPALPAATGQCLYCDEPLADPTHHFCDAECCHAWDYEQERRRVNGATP